MPDLGLGGVHEPLTTTPVTPAACPAIQIKQCLGGGIFVPPVPLLWDERIFINDFRLISLPSGHRWLLPSHHALKTDRVFCPGLKRTLFVEQSEQHVKRRRKKKKKRCVMFAGRKTRSFVWTRILSTYNLRNKRRCLFSTVFVGRLL